MFPTILVPLDGSAMAEQAILPAGDIARRLGASLVLAVVHPWGAAEDAPFSGTEADLGLRRYEDRYLLELRDRVADTFHVPVETHLLAGDPARALAEFTGERRVGLVVSGTRGVRGGVSLRLVHSIACPALLLKPRSATSAVPEPDGFARILVPLDGSAAAETSLEPAIALAASRGVAICLVRVVSPLEVSGAGLLDRRSEAIRYLNGVAGRLERRSVRVDCRVLLRSEPGPAIAAFAADEDVDLVAITTRERGASARLLLGSVADALVRTAPVPVLVCHAAARAAAAETTGGAAAWRPVRPLPAPAPV